MNTARKQLSFTPFSVRGVILLVFLIMLVLTFLTPLGHDDYSYSFSFADDTRIRSIGQIIPSMAVHRELLNGRVVPHALVQFFLMIPKPFFNLFNAMNACILIMMVSRLLGSGKDSRAISLLSGVFIVWIFTPAFGENYLWLDGAVNYAWGLSAGMFFLYPYITDFLGIPRGKSRVEYFLRIPFALIAGAYSENMSLVFLFLAICLSCLIWKRDRRPSAYYLIWIVLAMVGYAFLMSAPATAGRHAGFSASSLANNLASVLSEAHSVLLYLYIICVLLLVYVGVLRGRRATLILSALLLFGGALSLCTFVFAAYFVPRHFCCTVFLTSLSIVLLVDEAVRLGKPLPSRMLAAGLAVVFAFQFSAGVLDICVSLHKAQLRDQTIKAAVEAGESSVIVQDFIPATCYSLSFYLSPDDPTEWPNNVVASYYGIDAVLGVEPGN